jgi:adenylate kinase family enzyme
MDGNFGGTLELRLAACDTVIFLDMPRTLCLWRVIMRRLRFHGESRPDMSPGCPERLSWEFVHWIWTYPRTRRPKLLERMDALRGEKTVVVLRSRKEVEEFLAS